MASLRIQLLGDFRIEYHDGPVHALDRVRLQSLLAYLLIRCHAPQPRQQIAFQLWPDSSERQARSNLRKALHQLRQAWPAVDRFLHIDAHTLQWRPEADYSLDVAEFEERIAQAQGLDENPTAQRAALEAAVALYHGDLLVNGYDDWILPERERLRQAFIEALDSLVWLAEGQRDYGAAIHHANHLLRCDPLHEATYRRLMRLHAVNGDRAAALQTYHTCATVLQRELGVEPGEETQQAYARLLEHELPAVLRAQQGIHPALSLRLVGRQPEWQTLRAAWEELAQSHAHFCLISGEAGIGKTRLAEELLAWVGRQGMATATTRSYAGGGALAYTPLIELLRSKALQSALTTLEDVWLVELARLLPEIRVERPELPRPQPLTERWQRQRLFEALARGFLADGQPKLLVLDDLQWCDADSLDWLRYLLHFAHQAAARQEPIPRLLVVGTARLEEVDRDHPLHQLLLGLRRAGQVTEIPLAPLGTAESTELAEQVADTSLAPDIAEQLFAQTEGNPLFIVETMRAGTGSRDRSDQEQPATHASSLSPKVQAVIQHRLAQLSPAAREVVSLAATIGRAFLFTLLLAAGGDFTEGDLMRRLDELWQRGIIRAQGGQAYDFSHDRIREVAYAQISPVQRPLLHRRVAQALESVYLENTDLMSGQLALHYERAGMFQRAATWYQRAGQMAQQLFAHSESISYLESGLALLDRLAEDERYAVRKVQLLLMLDKSVVHAYGLAPLRRGAILLRARELATRLHDDHALFDVFDRLTFFYQACGDLPEARQTAQEHLLLAQQSEDLIRRARAYSRFGVVAMSAGAFQDANQSLERARALLDRCDTHLRDELVWKRQGLDGFWIVILWILGFPDRAQEIAHRMLTLVPELGPVDRSNIPFFAAILYRNLKLDQPLAQQVAEMTRLGEKYSLWLATQGGLVFRGWELAHQGQVSEGIALTRRGVDRFRRVGQTIFQTHRLAMLAEMHLMANQLDEAQQVLDEALSISSKRGEHFWDVELHRLQGNLLLAQGAPDDQAEQAYLRAIAVAQQQSAKSLELRAVMGLCRLWQRQGKRTEAQDRLAQIYGWFSEGFDTADLQEARALLAELS